MLKDYIFNGSVDSSKKTYRLKVRAYSFDQALELFQKKYPTTPIAVIDLPEQDYKQL